MSILTSYKDGSLGSSLTAYRDGSLGILTAYNDGSLGGPRRRSLKGGCGCGMGADPHPADTTPLVATAPGMPTPGFLDRQSPTNVLLMGAAAGFVLCRLMGK